MLATSNEGTLVKVPARNLVRGDVTGSGETVLAVSNGARTPPGKVELCLQKGARQRTAVWNAHTIIGVRRDSAGDNPPVGGISSDEIPPSDRLPTFHELASFDAGAAWDHLSVEQQREVGVLALRFGTVGQCEGYFHETAEGVRKGFCSSHWTPQAQATAVWPRLHIELSRALLGSHFRTCASTSIRSGPSCLAGKLGRR